MYCAAFPNLKLEGKQSNVWKRILSETMVDQENLQSHCIYGKKQNEVVVFWKHLDLEEIIVENSDCFLCLTELFF